MTDSVTSQTLFAGAKRVVMAFTNVSDGTGEAAAVKVDISTLPGAPSKVTIKKVLFAVVGMSVSIAFDHTADDVVLVLQGNQSMDLAAFGGVPDPASAGGTGDLLFTTNGAALGSSYTIILELELS